MAFLFRNIDTCSADQVSGKSFDFIVVGAGSAGAVCAARLSEDPNVSVLLIEAGDEATTMDAKVPAACGKLQNTNLDWGFYTEPQASNYAQRLKNERIYYPRGKCLGGSSVLNYMAYVRGSKEDFDHWAAEGATGWSYEEVLPYFKKSERFQHGSHIPESPLEHSVHGSTGPLTVSVKEPVNPIAQNFVRSCEKLGFKIGDYNDGSMNGKVSLMQTTVREGSRCDTATAFLRASGKRQNLTIAVNSQVTKILLSNDCTTAVGVLLNRKIKVLAKKEVILSAGAIGSPQIMLLSGLGPREELEKVGVKCLRDMPDVGKHMEDHVAAALRFNSKEGKDIGAVTDKKAEGFPAILFSLYDYFVRGQGILSSSSYDGTLFYRSKNPPSDPGPDIQIGIFCSPGNPSLFTDNLKYKENYLLKQNELNADSEGFLLVPTLLHLRSRGEVRLKSSDPLAAPLIEPNYFDNNEDVQNGIEMMRKCIEIANQTPLSNMINPEPILPLDMIKKHGSSDSDEFWEDFLRSYGNTLYHPTSSLKIGKVVDERLRVYGIPNLRVVDASIMPHVTSGNTNAPSIMVGEKGADLIVEDYALKQEVCNYDEPSWFSFL